MVTKMVTKIKKRLIFCVFGYFCVRIDIVEVLTLSSGFSIFCKKLQKLGSEK